MTATALRNATRRQMRELREAVAWINTHWHSGGEALAHVTGILRDNGLDIGEIVSHDDDSQGSHRWTFEIVSDESGEVLDDTCLVWSTYRMPESGRYEVTCYLS